MGLFRRNDDRREWSGPELHRAVTRWLPIATSLDRFQWERLLDLTGALESGLHFEGSRGFDVTDDMRLAVAAHGALLVLDLPDGLESYHDVTSVIVHPSTIVRRGTKYLGDGLWTDEDDPVIGEAIHRGPVLVSWDAAAQQAREPWRGENVLLHEFAHRLDMLDGISDGTPLIADEAQFDDFVGACTRSLRRLRRHEAASVLRNYATTNPAEFFAVATEVFFTRPHALRDEDPDLYRVLAGYYRQDPSRRMPAE